MMWDRHLDHRWNLLGAVCCLLTIGCATPTAPQLRFRTQTSGMLASDPRSQQSGKVWAEGWVASDRGRTTITMMLRNRGTSRIPLSYVADRFVAQTSTGATRELNKHAFIDYPDDVAPGEEQSIVLDVPHEVSLDEITALIAKLDNNRLIVTLPVIRSAPPLSWPTGQVITVPATEPIPVEQPVQEPAQTEAPPGDAHPTVGPQMKSDIPDVWKPATPTEESSTVPTVALPDATVPVVVEFTQEFGGSLKLNIAWDRQGPATRLEPGDRRTFVVAPGPHQCQLSTGLPMIKQTMVNVPLVIRYNDPTRISVEASAALSGVRMHVRVFNTTGLIFDRAFEPGYQAPLLVKPSTGPG